MFRVGDKVKVISDEWRKENIGQEGIICSINFDSNEDYPFEVKFLNIINMESDNFKHSELQLLESVESSQKPKCECNCIVTKYKVGDVLKTIDETFQDID